MIANQQKSQLRKSLKPNDRIINENIKSNISISNMYVIHIRFLC